MIMTVERGFKSRWGFHPCDVEDFQKIKTIHKFFWIAKCSKAAWERWNNKLPHNRVIRERVKGIRRSCQKILGPAPEPFFPKEYQDLLKEDIISLYEQARMPKENVNLVQPLNMNQTHINQWFEKLKVI